MTTTLMIDATHANAGNIPEGTPKVAGYTTGTPDVAWVTPDWNRFPKSGKVRIEQGYTWDTPHILASDVLDVEARAITPAQAVQGVRDRIAAGIRWTTIYGGDSALASVQAELEAAGPHGWYYGHVDCWFANWNLSQSAAATVVGTLVQGMTCRAVQWASPTSNPGTLVPGSAMTLKQANVDLSVTEAAWHAYVPPAPPKPPAVTRAQAQAALATVTRYVAQ